MSGIEPGTAGWEGRMLPLCYAAPSPSRYFNFGLLEIAEEKKPSSKRVWTQVLWIESPTLSHLNRIP